MRPGYEHRTARPATRAFLAGADDAVLEQGAACSVRVGDRGACATRYEQDHAVSRKLNFEARATDGPMA